MHYKVNPIQCAFHVLHAGDLRRGYSFTYIKHSLYTLYTLLTLDVDYIHAYISTVYHNTWEYTEY